MSSQGGADAVQVGDESAFMGAVLAYRACHLDVLGVEDGLIVEAASFPRPAL